MAKQLLALLDELDEQQFERFKLVLRHSCPGFRVPWGQLASASRTRTADLLLQRHPRGARALALARRLLRRSQRKAAPGRPKPAPATALSTM
ncbi:hypothetical protein Y1Q_0016308 [Alligator mississippiensis]|uniref:Pyrin domain-containing protein n=1 Tax=Alligator mississippiensis TaxID=8496 RepID=A0A151N9R3_ALLMI|nr:hypothetical protein Y1Q_0016308 [Alligator mississippiensis]